MNSERLKFEFAEGLRFAFSGAIGFTYLFILDESIATEFAEAAGTIGFPIIITVLGSLIYFVYRPLIHDPIIDTIQFCIRKLFRTKPKHYRQVLMEWYSVNFVQSRKLWIQIRDELLLERYRYMRFQASGVHMTYLAGILGIIFALLCYKYGQVQKANWLLVFSIVTLVAAFKYGASYQSTECNMLLLLDKNKIDQIAQSIGFTRRSSLC